MTTKRIVLNEVSYFGPGSRSILPDEIERRGFKKSLIVTDKDLIKYNVVNKVTEILHEHSVLYEIFDEVKPNPTVSNVKEGILAFKESKADFILAIGGGSAIDTAKAIGIIINNPEFSDVVSLEGVANTKNKSVPIIALPTTAGTAAEVTINYVITDESNKKKMVCVDPNDIPILAIIDAEMMISMPKSLTAATGMDALTHAIEGYTTNAAWSLTEMFSLQAISMISKSLEKAVDNPNNVEARDMMATAQYIAGMGFSNAGLGLVHGMAHPLGAFYDIPHGVANALLLPHIMEYNMESCIEKYKDVAIAMGADVSNLSVSESASLAVSLVKKLAVSVNIPQHLSELGVKEEELEALAISAYSDVCTPGNPKTTSIEDIVMIYKKAF